MNPTILLVEDDENDAFFMARAFEKIQIMADLRFARDGREALSYLFGEGEFGDRERYPLPCLTLLDLNLPYVQGMEILKRIRQEPELRKLVIVVLTSSVLESDMEEAYELGANSFLTKPVEVTERMEMAELLAKYWLIKNQVPRSLSPQCLG